MFCQSRRARRGSSVGCLPPARAGQAAARECALAALPPDDTLEVLRHRLQEAFRLWQTLLVNRPWRCRQYGVGIKKGVSPLPLAIPDNGIAVLRLCPLAMLVAKESDIISIKWIVLRFSRF